MLLTGPTDLCKRGDTLWDFFDPERSTLHREAVAAAAGGASQRRAEGEGQGGEDESGKARAEHGGFAGDPSETTPEEIKWKKGAH